MLTSSHTTLPPTEWQLNSADSARLAGLHSLAMVMARRRRGGGMQSPDDLVICIQCLLVIRMWKCSTTKNPVAFYHRHRHHHKIMPNAESDHYFSVSTMELLRSIWFSIDIKVFRKVFGSESSLRFFVNVLLWFKKLSDSALQCWERSHVNHLYYRANRAIGILRQ